MKLRLSLIHTVKLQENQRRHIRIYFMENNFNWFLEQKHPEFYTSANVIILNQQ